MTTLNRPVTRQTAELVRSSGALRPLVIRLHERYVEIGPKGTRLRYIVSYEAIFQAGAKIRATAVRVERAGRGKRPRD